MESMLLISCIRFSIELLICESVFLIGRSRKPRFGLRLIGGLALYALGALLWYAMLHQIPNAYAVVYILFYLGLLVISTVVIWCAFDLPPIEILFAATGGYATEHIIFCVVRAFRYLAGLTSERVGIIVDNLVFRILAYVLGAAVMYTLVIRPNRDKEEFKAKDTRMALLSMLILIFAIILSVFTTTSEIAGDEDFINQVICSIYSALSCTLVLLLEYNVFRENRLSREKETMEQLLQMADNQQKSSKEAIDIINMKCHDLKHQLRMLEGVDDVAQRSEYLREAQKAISIYDATFHTGCESLDYVLREKALMAEEYHVQLSCMADGTAINYLSPPDLYALMGNALDNALESVLREPEEQRIVSLNISRHGQMVMLHLENQCTRSLEFEDGLPVTDKENRAFHGFGVRSIRYITEKYGGQLFIRLEKGTFSLDILLPSKTATAS